MIRILIINFLFFHKNIFIAFGIIKLLFLVISIIITLTLIIIFFFGKNFFRHEYLSSFFDLKTYNYAVVFRIMFMVIISGSFVFFFRLYYIIYPRDFIDLKTVNNSFGLKWVIVIIVLYCFSSKLIL